MSAQASAKNQKTKASNGKQAEIAPHLNADTVAAWLQKNTDFFIKHPQLLTSLDLPAGENGENVTSMFAFQTQKLRTALTRAEEKSRLLLHTSVQNMASQAQIHTLCLQLMGTDTPQAMLDLLTTTLTRDMAVDSVELVLLDTVTLNTESPHHQTLTATTFATLFKGETAATLRTLYDDDAKALHGKHAARTASDALIRLQGASGHDLGLLALGSHDRARFHPGQGSDLLGFLGRVAGLRLAAHVSVAQTPIAEKA